MPALHAADDPRTAASPAPARAIAEGKDAAGWYLTDGAFLYRVVDVVESGPVETVELEDCYRLDIVRVSIGDLRGRRLRVVTPSPDAGA